MRFNPRNLEYDIEHQNKMLYNTPPPAKERRSTPMNTSSLVSPTTLALFHGPTNHNNTRQRAEQSTKMNHEISGTAGFRAFFFLQTSHPMIPAMASAPPTPPTTPPAMAPVCDFSAGAGAVVGVVVAVVVLLSDVLPDGSDTLVDAGPMLEPKVENEVGDDESLLVEAPTGETGSCVVVGSSEVVDSDVVDSEVVDSEVESSSVVVVCGFGVI
jgi:hypothetical protein